MAEQELMSLEDLELLNWVTDKDRLLLQTARAAHEWKGQAIVEKLTREGAQMERDQLKIENEKLREQLRTARREEREKCIQSIRHLGKDRLQRNRELIGFVECIESIRALGDAE